MKHLKFNTFLLTQLLSMAGITAAAHSFEAVNEDGKTIYYVWTNENHTELAVSYRGNYYDSYSNEYSGNVVIPESVTYNGATYPVTTIGGSAFRDCTGLTSVTIPNSVTSIGGYAFSICSGLTSVTIPNSMTSIDGYAFQYCSALTSVTIPESVTSIGSDAFYGCSGLTSVTIPNSVTSIGDQAFYGCSGLTSVAIGNSVTSIGKSAFDGCSSLIEVNYNATNCSWMGNSDYPVFSNCNSLTTLHIGDNVKNIPAHAFSGCSGLTSMTIGNSVTDIGFYAFYGCSGLTSVTIPNSVTYIGRGAFGECSNLTSVTIPNSVTSIGYDTFDGCHDLTSVKVPVIDFSAFCRNKFMSFIRSNIGLPVDLIDEDGNVIRDFIIPDGVTYVDSYAFYYCTGLTSVTIPNSVTSIGSYAFSGCSGLTSVTISSSVTSIGSYAFSDCSGLTSVTIPNSVTSIGDYAFSGCSKLESVTIGTGVLTIGSYVFSGHKPAKVIWLTNTPPSGYSNAAGTVNYVANDQYTSLSNKTVYTFLSSIFEVDGVKYVPVSPSERTCDAIDCIYGEEAANVTIGETVTYRNIQLTVKRVHKYACYQNSYINNVEIGLNGNVEDYAFYGCPNLTTADLGDGITSIGNYTFANCSKLEGIVIPNAVTSIGQYAFQNCSAMASATIGTAVKTVGQYAFSGCTSIQEIEIPQSVTTINNYVFNGCTKLKNVLIDDRSTTLSLGSNGKNPLFSSCPLDSVYIGGKLSYNKEEYYGYSPFYRNTSLRSVMITDKETEISENEFYGCTGLKNVFIGDGVTTIGNWAFSGCSSLDHFAFGSSVTSIGQEAFSDCTAMTLIKSHAATPPTCGTEALDDISKWDCTLEVPKGSATAYQAAAQWKEFFFTQEENASSIFYKLTYMVDGETYKTYSLHYGDAIAAEPEPVKEGYAFSGWSEVPQTMPARDVVVRGTFTLIPVEDVSGDTAYLLSADPVDTQTGAETALPIAMKNEAEIVGFQFDLTLPEGITLAPGDGGLPQVTLGDRIADADQAVSVMSVGEGNRTWRFVSYSLQNTAITGTSGTVLSAMLSTTAAQGAYDAQITKAVLTRRDGTQLKLQDSAFRIVVCNLDKGDANGDGEVNVTDIVEMVNDIMERPSDRFVDVAADMNIDGEVNVTDIVLVVGVIMGDDEGGASRMSTPAPWASTANDQLTLVGGLGQGLSLWLTNEASYVAAQMDIRLSAGQTLEGVALNSLRSAGHLLTCDKIGDGHYRVVVCSLSGSALLGNSGELLSLDISGEGTTTVERILLVTADAAEKHFAPLTCGTTGIDTIAGQSEPADVYTTDGRLVRRQATSLSGLKKGIYVVNGKKMVVR